MRAEKISFCRVEIGGGRELIGTGISVLGYLIQLQSTAMNTAMSREYGVWSMEYGQRVMKVL